MNLVSKLYSPEVSIICDTLSSGDKKQAPNKTYLAARTMI